MTTQKGIDIVTMTITRGVNIHHLMGGRGPERVVSRELSSVRDGGGERLWSSMVGWKVAHHVEVRTATASETLQS